MTQGRRSEEHHPEKRKSIRGPDESTNIPIAFLDGIESTIYKETNTFYPEMKNVSAVIDIFKVYCFDHTYTTLRLPMDTKAEVIATQAASKLCLEDEMLLYEVKSTGG